MTRFKLLPIAEYEEYVKLKGSAQLEDPPIRRVFLIQLINPLRMINHI